MNTLQEVMQKITDDKELSKQFMAAVQEGQDATVAYLQSLGCNVTAEELLKALNDLTPVKELTPEEMEFVAGGSKEGAEAFFSGVADFCIGFLEGTHG